MDEPILPVKLFEFFNLISFDNYMCVYGQFSHVKALALKNEVVMGKGRKFQFNRD